MTIRRAAVIGAGLAGASVANALAQRGWAVAVFDAAAKPAQGASGLPVGLMSARTGKKPHTPVSPLAVSAAVATRQVLQQLREGVDWAPSGAVVMPDGLVDADVCWVKPAALVTHWMGHPQIAFWGNTRIDDPAALTTLVDGCDAAVVCAGPGSKALLPELGLHTVRGQVSHARMPQGLSPVDWPIQPVRGDGTFIPNVVVGAGEQASWLSAASYEHTRDDLLPSAEEHQQNRERVARLIGTSHPTACKAITEQFSTSQVSAWVGLRCTAPNRQPVAQRVSDKVYVLTALGSRGITLAALLGQRLAEQIDQTHPS